MKVKQTINIEQLNHDIQLFPQVHPITADITKSLEGVSKLVMLDRYAFKDTEKKTLAVGDFVVLTIKEDPKFPARGTGFVTVLDYENNIAHVQVEDEYHGILDEDVADGLIKVSINVLEKPLELFYEQIALRNATGLTSVEKTPELQKEWFDKFYEQLASTKFVPAGRVLYGAGSETQTTFFNCYVMPYIKDSREGISDYRSKVMEIMSRGGGVGTNGSTLRPRNALARGVNGKSSGMVSWLHDLACLTNLVEQGGSRRGAQMIMVLSSHPDVLEFIISKMQNPKILKFIIENFDDEQLIRLAKEKLKFTPLSDVEAECLTIVTESDFNFEPYDKPAYKYAEQLLKDGGRYSVHNPDFLTGANISIALTEDFMEALEKEEDYTLQFPDVENYNKEEMQNYNDNWHNVGDPRKWAALGYGVKTYRTIKAKVLWDLINLCATYAAEPGIFFIDNANDMTNAAAYGQQVVATNPCGEQPLAPYSVCNLAAVNLAAFADKVNKTVKFEELIETVKIGVRMQDNVIDATPYFLEENKTQALGERRVGLGVMGLADLLIYCEKEYGSEEGNVLVDKIFETIATAAYEESIELAKERGSFPFLQGETDKETARLRDAFINTGFMNKMPEHIREGVLMYGIRNSHLLTVAPTGSTGTMVGVATGLEPYYSFLYYRSGRLGKFIEVNASIVDEYYERYYEENPDADRNIKPPLPPYFISSMELSPEAHADVQCIIQRWIDSSISKTVNAPKGYTVEQVQSVYERLWRGGAKGGTVYVDGSRDSQVLTLTAEDAGTETTTPIVEKQKNKIFVLDTIAELTTTNVNAGSEIGDTCPVCRKGQIRDLGGCNTCDNCKAQVSCGL